MSFTKSVDVGGRVHMTLMKRISELSYIELLEIFELEDARDYCSQQRLSIYPAGDGTNQVEVGAFEIHFCWFPGCGA
ncbi:hypothetical protein D918_01564 [Trichuris suis]|nr:hypothetical protein D918_01564 [Trichuris suis]